MASKGYDDSPPRNGVIFFYTVLSVVVLFGVSQLLKSYFAKMMDTEIHEKVLTVGLDKAYEARTREAQALEKNGISTAMRAYATRGRMASPVIASESGAAKPAIGGWSQLKREVPPAAAAAQPTQSANAAEQPANPNAAEPQPTPAAAAPTIGRSPASSGSGAGSTAPAAPDSAPPAPVPGSAPAAGAKP